MKKIASALLAIIMVFSMAISTSFASTLTATTIASHDTIHGAHINNGLSTNFSCSVSF